MIPKRGGRHDLALEIFHDGRHRLAVVGAAAWQRVTQFARLDVRQDRMALRVCEIIRHPVHGFVCDFPEFFGGQMVILANRHG